MEACKPLFYILLVLVGLFFVSWLMKRNDIYKNTNANANSDPPHGYSASLHDILDHIVTDRHFFNLHEPRAKYNAIIQELLTNKRGLWMFPCNNVSTFHNIKVPIYYAFDKDSNTAYELRYIPSKVDWEISQVIPRSPPPVSC